MFKFKKMFEEFSAEMAIRSYIRMRGLTGEDIERLQYMNPKYIDNIQDRMDYRAIILRDKSYL